MTNGAGIYLVSGVSAMDGHNICFIHEAKSTKDVHVWLKEYGFIIDDLIVERIFDGTYEEYENYKCRLRGENHAEN